MKKVKKVISFPSEMVEQIKEFKEDNFITTFTGAVIELVRRGLEYTKQNNGQTGLHKNLKELKLI